MTKKPKAILSPREFDAMCAAYKEAEATRDRLWKQLYRAARSQGALVPGAPKSRLLAGAQFEALASLGALPRVNQRRAHIDAQRGREYTDVFYTQTTYHLFSEWERHSLAKFPTRKRERIRQQVLSCVRFVPTKRLSVRKRKSAASAKSADRRKAA